MEQASQKENISRKFSSIIKGWFLTEPLYFSIAVKHSIVENPLLNIPLRTGQLRLEYNSSLLASATDLQLESLLKCEMSRVLLGHPYQRQPLDCKKKLLYLASDIILSRMLPSDIVENLPYELAGQAYIKYQAERFKTLKYPLGEKWAGSPEEAFFQRNLLAPVDDLSFEQWYRKILFLIKETSIGGSESAGSGGELKALTDAQEAGELWEENQAFQDEIKKQIEKAEIEEGWGGIGGNLGLELRESADFSFDYRRALTRFRAKIVSANRKLTRMRPSRRYGFKAMGSRYERKANILIAVDISGSISEESFSHFYRAINNFFFLGIIEKIDLIFFDVNLKNTSPIAFKGSASKIKLDQIKGRGGTSFQPAFDFFTAHSSEYSGMIIFTDGEGNPPLVESSSASVLWLLDSRLAFEKSRHWIESLPGNSASYLPF